MTGTEERIKRCASALTQALYDHFSESGPCDDVPEPWPDEGPIVCLNGKCSFCRVVRADHELRQILRLSESNGCTREEEGE